MATATRTSTEQAQITTEVDADAGYADVIVNEIIEIRGEYPRL